MIQKSLFVVLLMCALAALACNFSDPEITAVVEIQVPTNNISFAEGARVLIQVYAVDPGEGVSRIDLEIDDQQAETNVAPNPDGQAVYVANFEWRAQNTGIHSLSARAFRADDSFIGESEILINVVEAQFSQAPQATSTESTRPAPVTEMPLTLPLTVALPTNAPVDTIAPPSNTPQQPTEPAPTAVPASATPRGTITIGLNVRGGPGTNYFVIGSFLAGTEVDLIGRNQNGSWLVVPQGSGQGWVAAQFVDTDANISSLPVIQAPPPPPTATNTSIPTATPIPPTLTPTVPLVLPDLVIESVQIEPPFPPRLSTTMNITVTVKNQGQASSEGFLVQLNFNYGESTESSLIPFPSLEPGQTHAGVGFITMPDSSLGQSGNGNIIADVENVVQESDENNNLHATAGYTVEAAP